MLKTYELMEFIESALHDSDYENWEEFLYLESDRDENNILNVNFVELDSSGEIFENKYRITVEYVSNKDE